MTFGNSENRLGVHKFGDSVVNHWHTAEDLDSETPRESLMRTPPKGHDPDTYPVWKCTACDHRQSYSMDIRAGDEVVSVCPECGSLESFEVERVSIWEEDFNV